MLLDYAEALFLKHALVSLQAVLSAIKRTALKVSTTQSTAGLDNSVFRSGVEVSSPEARRTPRRVEVYSFFVAAAIAAFYLVSSIYIASRRLFWFDEIFTVRIAWLPHWATIWTVLGHAVDSQPPLYYLIVRSFDRVFGYSEVVARLPSALALTAGLLVTFDCARRLTNGLHGLIALCTLTCSIVLFYGYEARPYAIYFMISALALWIWTATKADSKRSAIFFGTAFFLGVAIHYYFVLCLIPYAIWEVLHWRPWQPPSQKLIAGVVGAAVPVILFYPLISSFAREFSRSFKAHTYLGALEDIFSHLFPLGFFLLPLIVLWLVIVSARSKEESIVLPLMQSGESLGWLFLCLPLAGFALAEWKTGAFSPRYFVSALPGIAVAFSCWLWRQFRKSVLISLGIFLLLMCAGLTREVSVLRNPDDPSEQSAKTMKYLELESRLHKEGKHLLLFSSPLLYMQAQYYSRHPDDCILLLPPRFQLEPRYQPQLGVLQMSRYFPLHVEKPPYELREHIQDAAVIQPTRDILGALKDAGFDLEMRSSAPLEVYYLK